MTGDSSEASGAAAASAEPVAACAIGFDVITCIAAPTVDREARARLERAARGALAPTGSLLVADVGAGAAPSADQVARRGEAWIAFRQVRRSR